MASLVTALLLPAPAVGADTVGVVDQETGIWTLLDASDRPVSIGFGNPGDVPFLGDWDCDGVDTPGLYRRSDGFVYLRNRNTTGIADITFRFGNPGDLPLVGDFDGNGCDTVSLYRPSEARIYVINRLGADGGGLGPADYSYLFGNPGDVPFVGDFDGDGVDTVGVRRPSDGVVYLRNSNSTGIADVSFLYGNPGDIPFSGDWDRDGRDTLGLYRPATGTVYLRNSNSTGIADETVCLGDWRSAPVAGSLGGVQPTPPRALGLRLVTTDLDRPLFAAAPEGDCRLFVVEQDGDIEVLQGGLRQPAPFLDLTVTSGGERGLLGLAFHPRYRDNGRFYVNYTLGSVTRISEFTVSRDPGRADPGSERILLEIPQPYPNHNGGMLAFDGAGHLVIALGDGGGAGDPGDRAENRFDLLGKLLRIDVDRAEGGKPYAIPPDNPFRGGGGAPEVWFLGLRNPWRFDIDQGLVYIADVGQDSREEITVVSEASGGANLGWNTWEGTRCFQGPCSTTGYVFPSVEYTHPAGCSVTGGMVYRGRLIAGLEGTYFYGDLCGGWIKSFRHQSGAVVEHLDRTPELGRVPVLSSFGSDGRGEIYVMSLSTGALYRIQGRP